MATNNLKLVDSNQIEQLNSAWEKKREELKITRHELQQRVAALRAELEEYCAQLEGVPFDVPCGYGGTPRSLDHHEQKTILQLVEELNPTVTPCSDVDLVLNLKTEAVETGFKIGMLAGVILAGHDAKTIDRFTRGLLFDLSCHRGLIKEAPLPKALL
jgi:hypothetical protein